MLYLIEICHCWQLGDQRDLKCKTKPLALAELDVVVPEDNCTIQRRITGLPREHADFHPEHAENVCVYELGKPLPRRCRIQETQMQNRRKDVVT